MLIKHNLLFLDAKQQAEFVASPNKSGYLTPLYLIMHYTAGLKLEGAVNWFSQKQAKASAHFVIGRDGKIVQMVPLNRIAWHAGKSQWGELVSMNRYSVGLEMVNAGKLQQRGDGAWVTWSNHVVPDNEVVVLTHKNEAIATGWHRYSEVQINTVIELATTLHKKYDLNDILGHDDVSPLRKVDPGPAFPLISVASIVMGREF